MNTLVRSSKEACALGPTGRWRFVYLFWLIVMGAVVGSESVLAQGTNLNWRWSNPSPFGNSITDLAWRTNRLYLAAGDRGALWVADALPDWRRVKTGTSVALRGATYL